MLPHQRCLSFAENIAFTQQRINFEDVKNPAATTCDNFHAKVWDTWSEYRAPSCDASTTWRDVERCLND